MMGGVLVRQHVDCGMLPDMSSDQPEGSAEGVGERGEVRLTAAADGPGGTLVSFAWQGDDIAAEGDVSRRSTGLVISRLEVRSPASEPVGLTHQLLRKVPLGKILAVARARFAQNESAHLRLAGGPSAGTLPPGRVQVTDELLRQVASAYLEETRPGKDRAVLQRLADRFQRPKGTVRTWLGRAREEGWLGPGVQGRPGAEPGPRLLDEWARQPMVMADGSNIVIQAPPPEGTETPEEARARVRRWLDEQPE